MSRYPNQHSSVRGAFTFFALVCAVLALVFWPVALVLALLVALLGGIAFVAGFLKAWLANH
jgi:hypothetical protein